jgi:hypothetical protein
MIWPQAYASRLLLHRFKAWASDCRTRLSSQQRRRWQRGQRRRRRAARSRQQLGAVQVCEEVCKLTELCIGVPMEHINVVQRRRQWQAEIRHGPVSRAEG